MMYHTPDISFSSLLVKIVIMTVCYSQGKALNFKSLPSMSVAPIEIPVGTLGADESSCAKCIPGG